MPTCPFIAGPAIQDPAQFYGRKAELQHLANRVGGISAQSLSIVAPRRMGKSSLLWQVVKRANLPTTSPYRLFHTNHHYEVIYLDLNHSMYKSNVGLMDKLRHGLQRANLPVWNKNDNGDLATLSYTLEDIANDYPTTRLVLCFDEFEAINKNPAEFDGLLEALRSEASSGRVVLVTASQTSLQELCQQGRYQASPFYNIFTECKLKLFTPAEWHELVLAHLPHARPDDLAFIERCAHGHPMLTQIAATLIWDNPTVTNYVALAAQFAMQAKDHLADLARQRRHAFAQEATKLSHAQFYIRLYDQFADLHARCTPTTRRADIMRWLLE